MAAVSNTPQLTYAMRFSSKITEDGRYDIFEATVANRNIKNIQAAAYQKLRRMNVTNPKRVYTATTRFLCPKVAPATIENDQGEEIDTPHPKHAERHMDDEGVVTWRWTKWLSHRGASTKDICQSQALEIVMAGPDDEEGQTIMGVIKTIVLATLKFAMYPSQAMPPVPTVFVKGTRGLPIQMGIVCGKDERNVTVWYNVTNQGWMVCGAGKNGSSVARRVALRLTTAIEDLTQTTGGKTSKKKKKEKSRAVHDPHMNNYAYRDGLAASLAGSSRMH